MPTNSIDSGLRRVSSVLIFLASSSIAYPVLAAEYYVSPTGNDANAGSMTQPFATLQKGHDVAAAGDTVWIRGGTYRIVTPKNSGAGIALTKSGTSDTNRIKFWAYAGERPVFDFAMLAISTSGYTAGFSVSGSYLHIKGLEIKNVPMNTRSNNGISVSGSNDIFELLDLHHISGTGIFIHGGSATGGHLVLNCDAHDNYDPTSTQGDGQNADGFGVHYQETGTPTILRGCRAWWNSDDGYDFISQEVPVILENSWGMSNGYINSGAGRPADGAGNGFKIGSSKTGIRHVVRNCLAWKNRASGFYANHSSGGNDWFNNTAYQNGTQFNLLASTWDAAGNRTDGVTLTGARAHKMRNNIGYPNKNSYVDGYGVDTTFNTWDLGITPTDSDFASVSDSVAMGPRGADGSLPSANFMKLSSASRLVDKGTNVGLPFAGTAPDLGCYEAGLPSGGTAGMGGAGGGGIGGRGGSGGATTTGGMSTGGAAGSTSIGGAAGTVTGGSDAGGATNGGMASGGGTATGGAASGGTATGGSGGSAGTATSGGTSAGGSGSDAGGSSSGGTNAAGTSGEPATTVPPDAEDEVAGCGCRTAQPRGGSLGAILASLLAVVVVVGRRVRFEEQR